MPHIDIEYKYEKLPKYPGMRPLDREIWEAFIEKNPKRFNKVWYNMHVGESEKCPDECDDCIKHAWHDLTRWKIDVVADDNRFIYVIELKPHAGAGAIGQAQGYKHLYSEEKRPQRPVKAIVITDLLIKTAENVARAHNVQIWAV